MDEVTQRGALQSIASWSCAAVLSYWQGLFPVHRHFNWDDFVHFHPDERFLTGVVTSRRPVLLLVNVDGYTVAEQ
jgi:hypothetical protein